MCEHDSAAHAPAARNDIEPPVCAGNIFELCALCTAALHSARSYTRRTHAYSKKSEARSSCYHVFLVSRYFFSHFIFHFNLEICPFSVSLSPRSRFFFIHLLSRMHKIRLDDFVSLFDLKTENRKNNMKKRIFVTRRRKSKRKSSTK